MKITPRSEPPEFLVGDGAWEEGLAFTAAGRLVSAGRSRLTVWDVDARSGSCFDFRGVSQLESVAAHPTAERVAVVTTYDHGAALVSLDATGGATLERTFPHDQPVRTLAFSPDGRWLATGGGFEYRDNVPDDPWVRVWEVETGDLRWTLKGLRRSVTSLAWSTDGARIAAGAWGQCRVWTVLSDGEPVKRPRAALKVRVPKRGPLLQLAWTGDGDLVIAAERTIGRTTPDTGEQRWLTAFNRVAIESCRTVAMTPAGVLATVLSDVVLLDSESGQARGPLRHLAKDVRVTACSPDGRSVAAVGLTKSIKCVSLTTLTSGPS